MPSFDEDYLARREKQIQELYMLRANTWACLITGLLLTAISIVLMSAGHGTLGAVLFGISLLFEAGSLFMFFSYFGMKAADRAFQEEYARLLALYGSSMDKPKRGSREDGVPLPDDGELPEEIGLADEVMYRPNNQRK